MGTAAGGFADAAGQSDGGDEREGAETGSQGGGLDRIEGVRGRSARGRAVGKRPSDRPLAGDAAGAVSRSDAVGAAGTTRLRSRTDSGKKRRPAGALPERASCTGRGGPGAEGRDHYRPARPDAAASAPAPPRQDIRLPRT